MASAGRSGAEPRSDAIVLSPSGCTSDTTTPVRSPRGPRTSTPRLASSRRTIAPASSSACTATIRALAPSWVAHAATLAAWPPGASLVAATASSPGARRVSRRTITSRSRSPRVQTSTVGLSRGRGGQAGRAAPLLHVRRAPRRVGSRRGRPQAPPDARPRPDDARRTRRVRGCALLRRDAREGSRSRASLARAAGVEAAQSQRPLDREQIDVRVAEVERLTHELHRLRLEQELADRAGRLAAADDEERPEDAGLEPRRGTRVAQRDVQPRCEVVVVARVEHPDAAAERLRILVEHV